MSQSQKTPVSEVIRNSESLIFRVIDIRRRAADLFEQAARLQEDAYLAAVADLGVADGAMAFGLACRGLGVDPTMRAGNVEAPLQLQPEVETATPPASSTPIIEAPIAAPAARPTDVPVELPFQHTNASNAASIAAPSALVAVLQTLQQRPISSPNPAAPTRVPQSVVHEDDASRLVRYGVAIKRSKLPEAEELIDQARRAAAHNRKANPYSDDRGRNAWRNTLFAAVLSAEGLDSPPEPTAIQSDDSEFDDTPSAVTELEFDDSDASAPEASTHEEASTAVAKDNTIETTAVIADPILAGDVLDDEVSLPTIETVPASIPSRAVPFTNNPVQSAQNTKPEQSPTSKTPFARQSSSFGRPVPSPVHSTPELHVDRPVQNRTFAHGQAVPMPKGLKDAIKKVDDDQPSTPTITPAPLRRAPSFVPRS
jgi:hypothetical protein